jgi:hypothetical protein
MLYAVSGEWIEDPTASLEEAAAVWKATVKPGLEALARLTDQEKKIFGVYL